MQQLAFDEHGSGPHTVILLHGFPFTSAIWQAQREALGNGKRRIVTPDLPGFGRTKGSEESMDAYAEDVRALIDKLGAQRVILGGFSMGGYVALAFARKYADRLEGLLLVDTKADPDSEEARVGHYALIERVEAEGPQAAFDAMLPRLIAPDTKEKRPEVIDRLREIASGVTAEGVVGALTAMAERPDSTTILGDLTIPALIIVGMHDQITPSRDADELGTQLPMARIAIIDDAGHATPVENPPAVTAAIQSWLIEHGW